MENMQVTNKAWLWDQYASLRTGHNSKLEWYICIWSEKKLSTYHSSLDWPIWNCILPQNTLYCYIISNLWI